MLPQEPQQTLILAVGLKWRRGGTARAVGLRTALGAKAGAHCCSCPFLTLPLPQLPLAGLVLHVSLYRDPALDSRETRYEGVLPAGCQAAQWCLVLPLQVVCAGIHCPEHPDGMPVMRNLP